MWHLCRCDIICTWRHVHVTVSRAHVQRCHWQSIHTSSWRSWHHWHASSLAVTHMRCGCGTRKKSPWSRVHALNAPPAYGPSVCVLKFTRWQDSCGHHTNVCWNLVEQFAQARKLANRTALPWVEPLQRKAWLCKNKLFPAKLCVFGNVQGDSGRLLTGSCHVYSIHFFADHLEAHLFKEIGPEYCCCCKKRRYL